MKKIAIYFVFTLIALQAFSQDDTLLTINNKVITTGEFLRIYQKNNTTGNIEDKKSIEEYLDLFINFKLKVAEAEARGMDTLPKFIKELKGYQKQLEKPYFIDKKVDDRLIQEAYDRQQYDVRASHILIMVDKNASPADTLAAYKKISSIRNQIVKGKKDFTDMAKKYSEDPSAKQNGGDLGYFTVFQMVYSFENAAYNTKVGEVSEIVKSRYGYHILKVVDKRKSKGEILVAHIMVALPKNADSTKIQKGKEKIDMIYSKIQNGSDFKELAQLYSDDKGSARKGGVLSWVGTGKMPPSFDKEAFGLENIGDYSTPVRTSYGWHIIKLINRREPKNYDESKKALRKKINNDMRGKVSKDVVFNRLKKEYNYQLNTKRLDAFSKLIDKSLFSGKWDKSQAKSLNKTLFTLNDSAYSQQLFVDFLEKNTRLKRSDKSVKLFVHKMYKLFIEQELKKIEKLHLAEKYPEYRYLLQEYHDGILLFDLTDQEVWSKAIKDSTGLVQFYEQHKNDYMWNQRVEAQIYSTKNAKIMGKLKGLLSKKETKGYTTEYILLKLNKKDSSAVELVNEKIYAKGDYAIVDEANKSLQFFDNTNITTPLYFEKGLELVYIYKIVPKAPKLLNEVKGQLTADYQDYLEKKWVKELRQKYSVVINQPVWDKVKNK